MQRVWSLLLVLVQLVLCVHVGVVQGGVFPSLPGKRLKLPQTKQLKQPVLVNQTTLFSNEKLIRYKFVVPIAGTIAASIAELLTYPLDVAKVNMQVSRTRYDEDVGPLEILSSIFYVNGFFGLWRGFPAALLRQIFHQVLKVVLFEPLTVLFMFLTGAQSPTLIHMLLGGGIAGTIGAFLTTPFDRVKVRSQVLGGEGGYSVGRGLQEIFQAVRNSNTPHIRTMYTGASAGSNRAFLLNAAELASYNIVKSALTKRNATFLRNNNATKNMYIHLVSAVTSGFIASAVSAPLDRVKTLIMLSPSTYSGVLDCLSDVFTKQGLIGLYKGFFATWLRLAPFTIIFFMAFEYFNSLLSRPLS